MESYPTQPVSACPKDNNYELCRYRELKKRTAKPTSQTTYICVNSQIGVHIILQSNTYTVQSPGNALTCDLISYDVRAENDITLNLSKSAIKKYILTTLPRARIDESVDITDRMPSCWLLFDEVACHSLIPATMTFLLHSAVKAFSDQDSSFCIEQNGRKSKYINQQWLYLRLLLTSFLFNHF